MLVENKAKKKNDCFKRKGRENGIAWVLKPSEEVIYTANFTLNCCTEIKFN